MSLNPLTLLDNLIVEHGSSKITKENIAFLRDQIKEKDAKIAKHDEEVTRLQRTVDDANAKLTPLRLKINELERQLAQQYERYHGLDDIKVKILTLLGPERGTPLQEIADQIQKSVNATLYHLVDLSGKKFRPVNQLFKRPDLGYWAFCS